MGNATSVSAPVRPAARGPYTEVAGLTQPCPGDPRPGSTGNGAPDSPRQRRPNRPYPHNGRRLWNPLRSDGRLVHELRHLVGTVRYGVRSRDHRGRLRLRVRIGPTLGGHQRNHLGGRDLHRRPKCREELRTVLAAGLETSVHQRPGRLHVLVSVLV
ncbi:hypothetical protein [Streptosporangium sp. NPDC049376]|uniref:hypothetical protein n=1 Tax=Streptosporangium sp. NPDC049376 TaxID=3366192 RepID=UPI0037B506C0